MRFSARQKHCLQSMGIVPWVTLPGNEPAGGSESSQACVPGPPPRSVEALGEWLASCSLAELTGPAEAPLLVIIEPSVDDLDKPALTGDAASLFELMLRSIRLSSRDIRTCCITQAPTSLTPGVLCTPHTRALLLLQDSWPFDPAQSASAQHQGCLSDPLRPLWRVAHPRRLLEQPELKRQSWQVLKSVHALLAGYATP